MDTQTAQDTVTGAALWLLIIMCIFPLWLGEYWRRDKDK